MSSPSLKTYPGHSPALIASTTKVRDVKISPDGKYVVYQVQPFYKATDQALSEIWMADTAIPSSSRQLTSGSYNDRGAVFHPDGRRIYFLSDRRSPGKGSHIYSLAVQAGLETIAIPEIISSHFGRKGVQGFEISPNGAFVAFTSPDETTEEEAQIAKERRDVWVYSHKVGLSRLRVCDIETKEIWTLGDIRRDKHIESFTWSPDSQQLLYRLRNNRGSEYAEFEILLEKISVCSKFSEPIRIGTYIRSPSGPNIWAPSGYIVDLQSFEPHNALDARTLFVHPKGVRFSSNEGSQRLYGQMDDAVRIVNMQTIEDKLCDGVIAVEVSTEVDTHIDVVSLADKYNGGVQTLFTLFQTQEDAIWFGAWDARKVVNKDGEVSYVFAAVLSSAMRHQPPNVWAGRIDKEATIEKMERLSSHLQWLVDAPAIDTQVISWKTEDGTQLNGLVRYPPGYNTSWQPLPTVLHIHGGPYRRDIPDYMPYFCNWRELLASAGYLVISPNYRGSQGRGHTFAHDANLGIGVHDWPDCESMLDEVIRLGLADPERLAVVGWSHGGSLTAWGVTKTKTRFKAAVVGAGVSNWEGMVMESGSPELEAAIGQRIPWDHDVESTLQKMSPIHAVSDVTTAVLILHGERDERVPVGQAIGLWRGLKRKAAQRGKDAAELVVYPREPHGFVEQKHTEDVMTRVLVHLNNWMG